MSGSYFSLNSKYNTLLALQLNGSSTTVPTLQSVTDTGSVTTNDIRVNNIADTTYNEITPTSILLVGGITIADPLPNVYVETTVGNAISYMECYKDGTGLHAGMTVQIGDDYVKTTEQSLKITTNTVLKTQLDTQLQFFGTGTGSLNSDTLLLDDGTNNISIDTTDGFAYSKDYTFPVAYTKSSSLNDTELRFVDANANLSYFKTYEMKLDNGVLSSTVGLDRIVFDSGVKGLYATPSILGSPDIIALECPDTIEITAPTIDISGQTTFYGSAPHCNVPATNGNDLVTLGYVNSLVGQYSGGYNLFFNYSVPDGIYQSLGQSVVDSGVQQIVPITTDTTNQLVAKFVSSALGITTIPSGIWNMLIYSEVVSNGGTLTYFFEVYTLTGAIETLLFTSALSADVNANNTPAGFNVNGTLISPATIALTDKIVIKIYLHKDGAPLLVNTYFQYAYYSFIQTTLNAGTTLLSSNNTFTGTNDYTLSPTVPTATYVSNLNVANTTYVANNFVDKTTTQSILGQKTFSTGITTDTILATTSLDILNADNNTTPINIGNGISSTGTITLGRLTRQLNVYGSAGSTIEVGTVTSNLVSNSLDYLTAGATADLYNTITTGTVNIGKNMTSGGLVKLGGTATPIKVSNVDVSGNNITMSAGTLKCPTIIGFGTLSVGAGTTTNLTLGQSGQTNTIRGSAGSSISIDTGTVLCGAITAPSLNSGDITVTSVDVGSTSYETNIGRTAGKTTIRGSSLSILQSGTMTTSTLDGLSAVLSIGTLVPSTGVTLGKATAITTINGSVGSAITITGDVNATNFNGVSATLSSSVTFPNNTTSVPNTSYLDTYFVPNTLATTIAGIKTFSTGITYTGTALPISENSTKVPPTSWIVSYFLSIATAASTYLTIANATSTYLTIANAASTYLTIANAASTYLTIATAASTYLTIANATSTYLTIANATSTYLTIANATSTYLTIANATSTYIPIAGNTTISGTKTFSTGLISTTVDGATLDLGQTTASTTKLGRSGGITNIYGSSASSSIAIGQGTIGCGNITLSADRKLTLGALTTTPSGTELGTTISSSNILNSSFVLVSGFGTIGTVIIPTAGIYLFTFLITGTYTTFSALSFNLSGTNVTTGINYGVSIGVTGVGTYTSGGSIPVQCTASTYTLGVYNVGTGGASQSLYSYIKATRIG